MFINAIFLCAGFFSLPREQHMRKGDPAVGVGNLIGGRLFDGARSMRSDLRG